MSDSLTVVFQTLGCRLNQSESEGAARFFSESGFKIDFTPVTADTPFDKSKFLFIINTCSVTTKAEQKARRLIRLILSKFPESTALVTGCYAELSSAEIKKMDSRICTLKGKNKAFLKNIASFLEKKDFEVSSLSKILQDFIDKNCENSENLPKFTKLENPEKGAVNFSKKSAAVSPFVLVTPTFMHHSRPALKIQDGCNFACTYCTIHIARGSSTSLDVEEILSRVIAIEKEGYGEVVFTTVNIANYKGFCQEENEYFDFTSLLKYLLDRTEKINFRISSIYPQIVDEKFCEVISDNRVCPFFHISVQSGSDKILKAMARPYKAEAIFKAAELLKKTKKDPFLACDIITGFPGETEDDFAETLELCKKVGFQQIHAFPYSPRPGTPAATMKPKIPNDTAGKRVKKLEKLSRDNISSYIRKFEEMELEAILESTHGNKISSEEYHAVTDNFLHCVVKFQDKIDLKNGERIKVKILQEIPDAKNEWNVSAIGIGKMA